jgi:hypothetical protein
VHTSVSKLSLQPRGELLAIQGASIADAPETNPKLRTMMMMTMMMTTTLWVQFSAPRPRA